MVASDIGKLPKEYTKVTSPMKPNNPLNKNQLCRTLSYIYIYTKYFKDDDISYKWKPHS